MKSVRIKWFILGFSSCFIAIVAFVAFNIFYIDNTFQVDLHTYSISLPTEELLIYTHDSCTESENYSGEHVLSLLKKDGTWKSITLDSNFSSFEKFILATSTDKEVVWAIDPIQRNWVEWFIREDKIIEHTNEDPPEFNPEFRYVKIDKT